MNETPDIQVNGQTYRIGKLDAMVQFHVARRVGPILAAMGISAKTLAQSGVKADSGGFLDVVAAVAPVIAAMSDEDVEYVIHACMRVTSRAQGERYQRVMTGKHFQFQDIDMRAMIELTVATLKENLGNFFTGAPDIESIKPD